MIILMAVLLIELLVLTYEVRQNREIPLVRQVFVVTVTSVEKGLHAVSGGIWNLWQDYVDLRGTRRKNEELVRELSDIKLDNERLQTEVEQAKRLQLLLQFKEELPFETVAAEVIGSGGVDSARLVMLDKGQDAGLRPDMAVMTPDGIVGKVLRVFPQSAQVLLLTDPNSGVACLLERSRIHGVLKGQNKALVALGYVLNDDPVQIGERVFTSGEDRIYPKGLPVGVVVEARPGTSFQEIAVQPFARLERLEEVLVVTRKADLDLPSAPVSTLGQPNVLGIPTPVPALASRPATEPNGQGNLARGHSGAELSSVDQDNKHGSTVEAAPNKVEGTANPVPPQSPPANGSPPLPPP